MRHRKRNIKFGRHGAHRKATVISLISALVKYNRIETTLAKAKEARRLADRLITWAKKGTLHSRRMVFSLLRDEDLVSILFKDLGPLFAKRNGGYTRVMHTRTRQGDGAQMAILEWTEKKEIAPIEKKKKDAKAEVKAEAKKEEQKSAEKAKTIEEKLRYAPPSKTKDEPKKKGFIGGIRKLFNKKKEQ